MTDPAIRHEVTVRTALSVRQWSDLAHWQRLSLNADLSNMSGEKSKLYRCLNFQFSDTEEFEIGILEWERDSKPIKKVFEVRDYALKRIHDNNLIVPILSQPGDSGAEDNLPV